jgi:hypothetical protein
MWAASHAGRATRTLEILGQRRVLHNELHQRMAGTPTGGWGAAGMRSSSLLCAWARGCVGASAGSGRFGQVRAEAEGARRRRPANSRGDAEQADWCLNAVVERGDRGYHWGRVEVGVVEGPSPFDWSQFPQRVNRASDADVTEQCRIARCLSDCTPNMPAAKRQVGIVWMRLGRVYNVLGTASCRVRYALSCAPALSSLLQ